MPRKAGRCCKSRFESAEKGHFNCFKLLPPYTTGVPHLGLFKCLHRALCHRNFDYATHVFNLHLTAPSRLSAVNAREFAAFCIAQQDPLSLEWALDIAPDMDPSSLVKVTTAHGSVDCMTRLLRRGVPWDPAALITTAEHCNMQVLEVSLKYSNEWHPQVPGVAACAGNVRFLMRVFQAGCPVWRVARDGKPYWGQYFMPAGSPSGSPPVELEDWSLVVSSDLLRSGRVLLLAAQKGAPLTRRMKRMLKEFRGRAQALACCFYRAASLGRAPGPAARAWAAIGAVDTEIIKNIATLAKISIVVPDLVR